MDSTSRKRLETLACQILYPNSVNGVATVSMKRVREVANLLAIQKLDAQLGMVEYFDQCSGNEDMNWKGLFADSRKLLADERNTLLKNKEVK